MNPWLVVDSASPMYRKRSNLGAVLKVIGVFLAVIAGVYLYAELHPTEASSAAIIPTPVETATVTPGPTIGSTPTLTASTPLPEVGQPSPKFSLITLDHSQTMTSTELQGKAVLINFWSSWCQPCVEEAPALEQAFNQYNNRGLMVLGVVPGNQDTQNAAQAFANRYAWTFPLLWDAHDTVLKSFGVRGLPTSIFIDTQGRVRAVETGSLDASQLDADITAILPPPPSAPVQANSGL
jgi:peroxiredoxin